MARLPQPGGDDGNWGSILNDFLSQELNPDGSLKIKSDGTLANKANDTTVVHSSGTETIGGTKTFTASPLVPTPSLNSEAANKGYVDGVVAAGAADATATTKGIVQLAGDLGGTAAAPTVPGLTSKVSTARQVATSNSLTGGGDLTANRTLSLVNDSAAPGNSQYYGTDNTGTKGYHALPAQDPAMGGDLTGTASNAQIAAGAIVDADVSATAAIAQSKIANLPSDLAAKEPSVTPGTTTQYYRGDKSWQTLDKTAVGLANVDNTTDLNKPISTATQTALNAKADDTAVVHSTLVDAKGDLIVATANDTVTRQPIGSDGQILSADSTQPTGVKWTSGMSGYVQGSGIAKITVGTTAPTGPAIGDVWINT